WSFPGGHVEAGESLHDALIRELREEIGVTPLSFEQIGAIEEPNAQANGDASYHMFAITAWSGGEPRALGREHSELSWFDLKAAGELRDLAMPDYLPILLRCAVMIDPKAVDGRTGTIGHLEAALAQNGSMSEFLSRFDEIALPGAWLVAGAIAQTVWNLAFGKPAELGIKDVDLVYFDADDLSPETEAAHEHRLRHMFRHFPVKLDVKNEARVHLWYAARFGYPIA